MRTFKVEKRSNDKTLLTINARTTCLLPLFDMPPKPRKVTKKKAVVRRSPSVEEIGTSVRGETGAREPEENRGEKKGKKLGAGQGVSGD